MPGRLMHSPRRLLRPGFGRTDRSRSSLVYLDRLRPHVAVGNDDDAVFGLDARLHVADGEDLAFDSSSYHLDGVTETEVRIDGKEEARDGIPRDVLERQRDRGAEQTDAQEHLG